MCKYYNTNNATGIVLKKQTILSCKFLSWSKNLLTRATNGFWSDGYLISIIEDPTHEMHHDNHLCKGIWLPWVSYADHYLPNFFQRANEKVINYYITEDENTDDSWTNRRARANFFH
jgi:hypothetical protein